MILSQSGSFADNGSVVSLVGGYARIGGYYSGKFQAAPGLGLRFALPGKSFYFYDGLFTIASYRLSGNNGSQMLVTGADAGINARYAFGRLTPFAGAALGMRYFYFHGKRTGEKIQTLKPAFGIRAGVNAQLSDSLSAGILTDYTISTLSGERITVYSISASISYRFGTVTDIPVKIDYYGDGMTALRGGDLDLAKSLLSQVEKSDPLYDDAHKIVIEISDSQDAYREGRRLISDNKKIEAIVFLEKASRRIIEASAMLQNIRIELRKDIPSMERNGIAAYDANDYAHCISIMQRIILIDPSNQTAKAYLERAIKRNEALKKLR
jgi:tetratricopeptide (TPR) repeat protein